MSLPILPIVIIGGVAYTLVGSSADDHPVPPTTGPKKAPQKLADLNARMPHIISASNLLARFGSTGAAFTSPTNKTPDPEMQKKLDAIEAAAKSAYDDMEDVAKVEAIDKINQNLGTDLPLDSDLSWDTISSAAYGAAGAYAGAAVCGPVCGKVGALAAAYLGAELNDLVSKGYEECKEWLKGHVPSWSDIGDAAEDAYDAAADALSGINPF